MSNELILRTAGPGDVDRLAELIHRSTNAWYRGKFGYEVFACSPEDVRLFVETYEALDPGQCLLIEDVQAGALAGSCFVHPRSTHVSLGILNVDEPYFGKGVARRLVQAVTDQADALGLPTRLVSSAMNLDSFSLYSHAGFVPYAFFQDMLIDVPEVEPAIEDPTAQAVRERVRPAIQDDVPAIAELERRHLGILRAEDLSYFVANANGCWTTLVVEGPAGGLSGYLAAIDHPASRIIGPGLAIDEASMTALLAGQLGQHPGQTMLAVVPSDWPGLVHQLYRWGGRNCETHVAQCRPVSGIGAKPGVSGVFLPTFMPETA